MTKHHRGWPALAVAASALLAGCHPGYPAAPVDASPSSETLFGYLDRVVHAARTEVRGMQLLDACTLQIEWTDGAVRTYDLMRLRTTFPREDDGERYAMLVHGRRPGTQRMLVGTSHWGQFMLARSSFSHLRGLCAVSRTRSGDAGAFAG